ncbi:ROK family protein [Paenarthrobacter sp. AR 02]|uniref:ROK family transcriptional regulator n=1 Tax=Paenarthrobacter sp. AR 02 TaxID=2899821 RepID=UPI001F3AEED4|nr:ROK family transcriptional regulator [Paenarthrobacter sp. AR 02]MCF3138460.1 ROK family protein [Paenarthrobacter sp. AR 02]
MDYGQWKPAKSFSNPQGGPIPVIDATAPGRVGDVRRRNLSRVLDSIAKTGDAKPSRAQLAAGTGLTKAAVSSLVADLVESGLVAEVGLYRDGERGRPGQGLELSSRRGVIGMEINVDYLAVGVVDLGGNLRFHASVESPNRGLEPATVMERLGALAAEAKAAAAAEGIAILGGGLAVPGLVDEQRSVVLSAPNLHWENEPLNPRALLEGAPLGVRLSNEANSAALGELWYGGGPADFLYVSGEVGVGGGVIIASELYTGPGGSAGELGHIVVNPDGPSCSCGGAGCLETFAGQEAIFEAAGIPPGALEERAELLLAALRQRDPQARKAVDDAGRYLGVALASSARLMDIEAVVLGGHFAVLGEWLRPALLASLERHAPGLLDPENLTLSGLEHSGTLLGAAGQVIRSVIESPFEFLLAAKLA